MPLPFFSIAVLACIVFFAFFGAIFYAVSPYALNQDAILIAPNAQYLLGTDRLGRDLLARLIEGGKVSLLIGVGSALAASFIGLILGSAAGYLRGTLFPCLGELLAHELKLSDSLGPRLGRQVLHSRELVFYRNLRIDS